MEARRNISNMSDPPFPELMTNFRELQGLTQEQLASRIGCSAASVSRWVNGQSLPHRPLAEKLDKELCAEGKLIASWRQATTGHALPEWARSLAGIETRARSLQFASPVLVPGYLQSPSYAGAVFRAWWPDASDEEIEQLTQLRTQRLSQLPQLRVTAVFPISGITGFDPVVRQEQAAHLLALVETGQVRVHLVPEGTLLLAVTAPLMVFRLRTGETVITSDHVDGNVVYGADRNDRLTSLITGAMAEALPARLSLEALKDLA